MFTKGNKKRADQQMVVYFINMYEQIKNISVYLMNRLTEILLTNLNKKLQDNENSNI